VAAAAPPSGGDTQGEQAKLIAGREQQVGFGGASEVLSVSGRTADSGEEEKQSVVGSRSTEGDKGRPRGERQPPNRVQAAAPSEQEDGEEGKTGR
jgi:hypothetical protein